MKLKVSGSPANFSKMLHNTLVSSEDPEGEVHYEYLFLGIKPGNLSLYLKTPYSNIINMDLRGLT